MLITVPELLTPAEVGHCRTVLRRAAWVDGRTTAGPITAVVKANRQVDPTSREAIECGEVILAALHRSAEFLSAALPLRILPPMFNAYGPGERFGIHVDNAIRNAPGSRERIRTDVSTTVFLSEPDEYEGGELTVETPFGVQSVKLAAGHAVVYPSTSLHEVTPVTAGERLASFFWTQSMIRDEGERSLLFDLDQAIQDLRDARGEDDPHAMRLSFVYHNLVRRWAET
ncbi:MAG: Fe2+-dependent dioxygenase [Siculibacillus sp.]|nr:Fe2+-dependent dioxygenase [Siculibacillus sp.]